MITSIRATSLSVPSFLKDVMIIGASADDIWGGCDKLLSKDWTYKAFLKRFTYTEPEIVLREPVSMEYAFYRLKRERRLILSAF